MARRRSERLSQNDQPVRGGGPSLIAGGVWRTPSRLGRLSCRSGPLGPLNVSGRHNRPPNTWGSTTATAGSDRSQPTPPVQIETPAAIKDHPESIRAAFDSADHKEPRRRRVGENSWAPTAHRARAASTAGSGMSSRSGGALRCAPRRALPGVPSYRCCAAATVPTICPRARRTAGRAAPDRRSPGTARLAGRGHVPAPSRLDRFAPAYANRPCPGSRRPGGAPLSSGLP